MSRSLKFARSKFEIISDYIDPKSPRNYGTAVLSDGTRLVATDGFGLITVAADSHAAGAYRASGELVPAIQPPQFGAIVDSKLRAPGRELQPAETLREMIGVTSKKPLFIGIGRHAPDLVIAAARPAKRGFGERVWFSASALRDWFSGMSDGATVRVQDDALIARDGEYVRILAATTSVD